MNRQTLAPRPKRGRTLISALLAALVVATMMFSGASTAQAAPKRLLTHDQLWSGRPVAGILNPKTGEIVESWFMTAAEATQISMHSVCNAGEACYVSSTFPYASYGFYGTAGTKTGSWPHRYQIVSGNYTVKACWTAACSPVLAPNTVFGIGSDVTGTSFRIY